MDHRYFYEGPVLEFDNVIAKCWRGETIASSKRKARSNLAYQFKKNNNRITGSRITLPGKVKKVNKYDY